MYLLILCDKNFRQIAVEYLHPTMYLLILYASDDDSLEQYYLHPTMYLLIREDQKRSRERRRFTSHYVSINSRNY